MTLNSAEQRQRIKEQSKKVADYLQQMTQEHPITPPPELVSRWSTSLDCPDLPSKKAIYIVTQAARWGADQELKACCEWLINNQNPRWAAALQEGRRSMSPSLKEQALQALYRFDDTEGHDGLTQELIAEDFVIIRRALESLPDQ